MHAVSGIYFALDMVEEDGKYILFALLVVGAMVFAIGLSIGGFRWVSWWSGWSS